MKLKLLATIFMLTVSCHSFAQVAYEDALKLKPFAEALEKEPGNAAAIREINTILSKYLSDKDKARPNLNQSMVKAIYRGNPFIPAVYLNSANENAPVGIGALASKAFSALGGIDVTNIANALSQVMIKRAKEELTVTFFNRFKRFADANKEFGVLFPKTTDNLRNLLSYKYPEMLPALRTGFFEDLKSITYHLDDVLELPRYQGLLKNFPEIRIAIRSIRLVQEIESGESHPADVLSKFSAFGEWKEATASGDVKNFGSSVKLAAVFSNSLRKTEDLNGLKNTRDSLKSLIDADSVLIKQKGDSLLIIPKESIRLRENVNSITLIKDERVKSLKATDSIINQKKINVNLKDWISFKDMQLLVEDAAAFKLYLGLIFQLAKNNDIRFYQSKTDSIAFTDIMIAQQENLFLFQNKVTEFIELANKVDKVIDSLKDKKERHLSVSLADAYDYIDASMDVIEYGFSIAGLFKEDLHVEQYTKIARKSNELYRNIYKQEYTQAVSNAMDILTEVNRLVNEHDEKAMLAKLDSLKVKFEKARKFSESIKSLDALIATNKGNAAILAQLGEIRSYLYFQRLDTILQKLTKYGLFMANLVNAKDADQIAAVIDNAILPVGSSSIKKYADFNISVQSYLGGFYRVGSLKQESNNAWSSRFGVTAPIGISFSYGFKKCGSLSLFGSLIDLGAIVDYQLKKDSTVTSGGTATAEIKKNYEVKLGQIFSPGIFLVYGFGGNVPLSLGFGGQYGPGLGKIETDNSTVVNNPQWRFNLFLAVDIPFFNITNRQKKYKQ